MTLPLVLLADPFESKRAAVSRHLLSETLVRYHSRGVEFHMRPFESQLDEAVQQLRRYLDGTNQVIDLGVIGLFHTYVVTDYPISNTLIIPVRNLHRIHGNRRLDFLRKPYSIADYFKDRNADADEKVFMQMFSHGDVQELAKLRQNIEKASAAITGLGIPRQRDVLIVRDMSGYANPITGGGIGGAAYRKTHAIEADRDNMLTPYGVELLVHEWGHKKFFNLPQHATRYVRNWFDSNVANEPHVSAERERLAKRDRQFAVASAWEKFRAEWGKWDGVFPDMYLGLRAKIAGTEFGDNSALFDVFLTPGMIGSGKLTKGVPNPDGGKGLRKGTAVLFMSARTHAPDAYVIIAQAKGDPENGDFDRSVYTTADVVRSSVELDPVASAKRNQLEGDRLSYLLDQMRLPAQPDEERVENFFTRENFLYSVTDEAVNSAVDYLKSRKFELFGADLYPTQARSDFVDEWIAVAKKDGDKFDPEKTFRELFDKHALWSVLKTPTIDAPSGQGMREVAAQIGLTPSSYAAANVDELWAELTAHAALHPEKVPKALKELLRDVMQGKTPGTGQREKVDRTPAKFRESMDEARKSEESDKALVTKMLAVLDRMDKVHVGWAKLEKAYDNARDAESAVSKATVYKTGSYVERNKLDADDRAKLDAAQAEAERIDAERDAYWEKHGAPLVAEFDALMAQVTDPLYNQEYGYNLPFSYTVTKTHIFGSGPNRTKFIDTDAVRKELRSLHLRPESREYYDKVVRNRKAVTLGTIGIGDAFLIAKAPYGSDIEPGYYRVVSTTPKGTQVKVTNTETGASRMIRAKVEVLPISAAEATRGVKLHKRLRDATEEGIDEAAAEPPSFELEGSLGIARERMPQIAGDDVDAFIDYLRDQEISVRNGERAAGNIKPTQDCVDPEKLGKMRNNDMAELKKPVIVSRDGYLLDGHHRWAVIIQRNPSTRIETWEVDLPMRKLLRVTKRFGKAFTREYGESLEEEARQVADSLMRSLVAIENGLDVFANVGISDQVARDAGKMHDAIKTGDRALVLKLVRRYMRELPKGAVQGGPKYVKPGSAAKKTIARAGMLFLNGTNESLDEGMKWGNKRSRAGQIRAYKKSGRMVSQTFATGASLGRSNAADAVIDYTREGDAAYGEDKPQTANPYAKGTPQYGGWGGGWFTAWRIDYQNGSDAARRDKSRDSNPNDQGTNAYAAWLEGWEHSTELNAKDESLDERMPTQVNPDQYHRQHGQCPDGYHFDRATGRCEKIGAGSPQQKKDSGVQVHVHVGGAGEKKEPSKPKPKAPAGHGAPAGPPTRHPKLRAALGHAVETVVHPFHAAWDLARKPQARKELRANLSKAIRKEGRETKELIGTIGKAIKGQKITPEERSAAISQAADVVKAALLTYAVGHIFAGGVVKALATIASPADEVLGIAIDKPLRALTTKLFGSAHGILPTAFYEDEKDPEAVLMAMFDRILDGLDDIELSDEDMLSALAKSGVNPGNAKRLATLATDPEDQEGGDEHDRDSDESLYESAGGYEVPSDYVLLRMTSQRQRENMERLVGDDGINVMAYKRGGSILDNVDAYVVSRSRFEKLIAPDKWGYVELKPRPPKLGKNYVFDRYLFGDEARLAAGGEWLRKRGFTQDKPVSECVVLLGRNPFA